MTVFVVIGGGGAVDPRNLTLSLEKVRAVSAELFPSLSVCGGWEVVVVVCKAIFMSNTTLGYFSCVELWLSWLQTVKRQNCR